jgi:hypothetical protein
MLTKTSLKKGVPEIIVKAELSLFYDNISRFQVLLN